jgi:hypothetical protein
MSQSQPKLSVVDAAIDAYIVALTTRLEEALHQAKAATEAMAGCQSNLAMGTLSSIETLLPEAQAFYNATIALHQNRMVQP